MNKLNIYKVKDNRYEIVFKLYHNLKKDEKNFSRVFNFWGLTLD